MPSDERDQTSPQAERLSRKIDRLQSGQPAPILDGDTEDLAEVARLLMQYLDPEQPDPEFRARLKKDLVDPGPTLVPMRRRPGPRRYPVPALFGALTVVLVASAVTGWMAFSDYRGSNDDPAQQFARFAAASPTAASASALVTATAIGSDRSQPAPAAPDDGSSSEAAQPATGGSAEDEAESTPDALSQAEPRNLVVELPPVDSRHVELGALATVVASPDTPSAYLRFAAAIDPSEVTLDTRGMAYEFSAPYIDANLMLRSVGDFLGVEAQIDKRERGGKTVYALSSPGGSVNFTWSPESGAFSCTLPDPYSIAELEDLRTAAIQWLKEFGYPVNASVQPIIRTMDDGQRYIDVPLGDIPNPAVGHPMSITLVLDAEDRIVSVSGYWLEVTRHTEVSLVSAVQAWDLVRAGAGYWPDGAEPQGSGEFSAWDFAMSYMLTSDDDTNHELALQPVIAITGQFTPDDGTEPYETTVYVKAQLSAG